MRYDLGRFRRPMRRSTETQLLSLIGLGDGSTLSLDFTAMSSLDSRFTFTRASTATYINSSGLVTTMAAASTNDPTKARFDHDPTTLAPRGLLIEGSVTNELARSNEFSTTPWYTLNFNTPTIASPSVTDPAGGTNTWYGVPSGSGLHGFRYNVTFTGSSTYTFSIWAKAAQHDKFIISDGSSGQGACRFDLTAKTATVIAGIVTPTNPQIIEYPNGWFRCSFTMVMPAATPPATTIVRGITYSSYPTGATISAFGATFTATGTDGMYFYGAQTEIGSGASSYIPTGASTVQRAADSCGFAASASWLNTANGTFVVNWHRGEFGTQDRGVLNTDYVSGRWLGLSHPSASNTVNLSWWNGQINRTTGTAINKSAYTYGQTTGSGATLQLPVRLSLNGSAVATGTFGNGTTNGADVPNPVNWTNFVIGAAASSAPYTTASRDWLNNCVRSIKYWPTVLPDATLQSLTA